MDFNVSRGRECMSFSLDGFIIWWFSVGFSLDDTLATLNHRLPLPGPPFIYLFAWPSWTYSVPHGRSISLSLSLPPQCHLYHLMVVKTVTWVVRGIGPHAPVPQRSMTRRRTYKLIWSRFSVLDHHSGKKWRSEILDRPLAAVPIRKIWHSSCNGTRIIQWKPSKLSDHVAGAHVDGDLDLRSGQWSSTTRSDEMWTTQSMQLGPC